MNSLPSPTSGETTDRLLVILGPTASGKTRLGVKLAQILNGEIISADSRQVFRGMDLGTGKDRAEYGDVPVHLLDVREAGEEYSVFHFQADYLAAAAAIRRRGHLPLLVGGTGLYLDAALRGYRLVPVPPNPVLRQELAGLELPRLQERLRAARVRLHNTTDLLDRERLIRAVEIAESERDLPPVPPVLPVNARIFGLRWERKILRQRIARRLQERLDAGMIDEVRRLREAGVSWARLEYYGLEYRFLARHLQGKLSLRELYSELNTAIGQFARRQESWFRRMERQGLSIVWLDGAGDPLSLALSRLTDWRQPEP